MKPRQKLLELAAGIALLCSFVAAATLLGRTPVIGVADNGDFWRVIEPAGLAPSLRQDEPLDRFVDPVFVVGEARLSRQTSSPACVAWIARELTRPFAADPGLMDLRSVGILYLVLLILSFTAIWRGDPVLLLIGVLVSWVVTDPGYLLFFNSFYAEPAMIVGFTAVVLWLCRWGRLGDLFLSRGWWRLAPLAALCAFLLFLGFSKILYSLLPLAVLAVLVPQLLGRRVRSRRMAPATAALLAVAAAVAPLYFLTGAGHRFEEINAFHRVFRGVAQVSSDPEATLRDLGISRDRAHLVGKSHFDADLSAAERAAAEGVSPLRVLAAYLTDPAASLEAARRITRALSAERTTWRGQYTLAESDGKARPFVASGWHFSSFRKRLLGSSTAIVVLWSCGVVWSAVRLRRGIEPLLVAVSCLLFAAFAQAVAAVVGDGFFALGRHLLAARLALDLALVLLLVDLGTMLRSRYGHAIVTRLRRRVAA